MKYRNLLALLMVLAMMLTLCACGAGGELEALVEESIAGEASAADPDASTAQSAVTAETEAEPVGIDFATAYAAYEPDTVIFYVGESGVTWQEFFYQIIYQASILAAQEGKAVASWDEPCTFFVDAEGNYATYGAVVLNSAINTLIQYHIIENRMVAEGITMGEEARDAVAQIRASTIDTSFGGDEAAFQEYLASVYCTEEIWSWFNEVDCTYSYDAFEHFYGEGGSLLSDDEVMEYADGDEGNGAWTEYVQMKLICIYNEEEIAQAEAETAGETADASQEPAASEEPAEAEEPAEEEISAADLLVQILTSEDREETFDALYAEYNEEPILDYYPEGWCVYQGDTDDAIYQTALSMEPGDCTMVSITGADVLVMKMPVDPDAGVTVDTTTETVQTLRYYAAWQSFSEMVGGENGWIATDSANCSWAEGFENFTLDSVF